MDRKKLHSILKRININTYFSPPDNFQLPNECIVYELIGVNRMLANNNVYNTTQKFSVLLFETTMMSDRIQICFNTKELNFKRQYKSNGQYVYCFETN